MIKVALLGATGRMGRELKQLLADHPQMALSDSEPATIWIDFSAPEATLSLLEKVNVPVVIGTTGFTQIQREAIVKASYRIPILLSSNMSPGIFLLKKLIEQIPPSFQKYYGVEMVEHHHDQKKDKPSGTALSLADSLKKGGWESCPIHSLRLGGELGTHTVKFANGSESITFEHRAMNRRLFAEGALLAAQALLKQPPGLYGMEILFS